MEIDKIAAAAMLELGGQERYAEDVKEILAAFATLGEIDTSGVESSFLPFEEEAPLREDDPGQGLPQERALREVRNKEGGFILGPKTV